MSLKIHSVTVPRVQKGNTTTQVFVVALASGPNSFSKSLLCSPIIFLLVRKFDFDRIIAARNHRPRNFDDQIHSILNAKKGRSMRYAGIWALQHKEIRKGGERNEAVGLTAAKFVPVLCERDAAA